MKLGVMAAGLASMGWERALDTCRDVGLDAIEIPVGAYPGSPFFDPAEILASDARQRRIKDDVARRGLQIIGLAVHGNPVSPDPRVAAEHGAAHDVAVRLAPRLGTDVVITFSGCPGGAPGDAAPNWVTCPWPEEYARILKYQWNDVLIPFWSDRNVEARNEGVRIAIEAHPGFCVYNTETILRLRSAAGDQIGANLDPSHFFWQGIDPVEAARVLGEAECIYHVHGKDTGIHAHNMRINGGLDGKSYGDLTHRSWVFRTCGYGHGDEFWKPFISTLRMYRYDGVISIEHEDAMMSVREGFERAVAYLKPILIRDPPDDTSWY